MRLVFPNRALAAATLVAALAGPDGAPTALASDDAPDQASPALDSSHRRDWVGTWATALTPASPGDTGRSLSGFEDESIRQIVQTSVGGDRVRIRLSNAYGADDLVIGRATIALPQSPSAPDLDPSTVHELRFRGNTTVVVPPGEEIVSDAVSMAVPAVGQLAVTVYLPQATGPTSWHWIARQTSFVYDGDRTTDPSGAGPTGAFDHFYFLAAVDVVHDRRISGAVVVLGHSIPDGFGTTVNANRRWPDFLARRIRDDRRRGRDLGVLNLGLAGNALTHDGDEIGFPPVGPSGVTRLDEHVHVQSGVRTVIVDLGINDIFRHDDPPERIIAGLRQITADLRRCGYRVLLTTLSPAAGPATWTPVREATRQAVNRYIRTTRDADGVVDAAVALGDPADPTRLNPVFDSGDNVHPNDQGAMAIASAVPLWLL
jgi:lysophospholipase L1-like esterase